MDISREEGTKNSNSRIIVLQHLIWYFKTMVVKAAIIIFPAFAIIFHLADPQAYPLPDPPCLEHIA